MPPKPFKVGLLLDGYDVAAWEEALFRHLIEGDVAEVALVVLNARARPVPKGSLLQRVARNRGRIVSTAISRALTTLYERLVDRSIDIPDATERTDARALLADIPSLEVTPDRGTYSDYFEDSDVEAIRTHGLDILIRIGFGILRGEILRAARYGVWSLHHGDNRVNRGGPPGFWESLESWPVTGSMLQILNEDLDNGLVLYRSLSRTNPFSLRASRSVYYWKSLTFFTRAMEELRDRGEEAFMERVARDNRHPTFYSHRLYRNPTVSQLARLTFGKIWQKIRWLARGALYFDQWILLYSLRPDFSSSLWRYRRIVPPKDRFWADPHVLERDGTYYVFIEEFLYATSKGHISVLTVSPDGKHSEPRPVLQRPYHLSYPFVFEADGEVYMIPETMANRTVELYRCTRFPDEWTFVMNLMEDVEAVDATLVRRDGRWWLFANLVALPGCSTDDELHLFSADELLTRDWRPHPRNPIVSDCTRARPAGKLFTVGDRLYRPSQNCGHRYGYGFNLSQVTELSETEYAEEVVSQVEPLWAREIVGTHTFNHVGPLHLSDAQLRRRR